MYTPWSLRTRKNKKPRSPCLFLRPGASQQFVVGGPGLKPRSYCPSVRPCASRQFVVGGPGLKPRSHCPGERPGASRQFVAAGPGPKPRSQCPGVRPGASQQFVVGGPELIPCSHYPGVRPGASGQFVAGGPGLKPRSQCPGVECVHTFPAVLRTRPCLGQNVITVFTGYATVCDGITGVAPEELRCVPIRLGSAPGIGDRSSVSLRRVTEVGRQSLGVTR